jgi:hypothetical protein
MLAMDQIWPSLPALSTARCAAASCSTSTVPFIFIDIAAHLQDDLGVDRVWPRRLEHTATLDGRHDAFEICDRGEAVVERLRGREGMIEFDSHSVASPW